MVCALKFKAPIPAGRVLRSTEIIIVRQPEDKDVAQECRYYQHSQQRHWVGQKIFHFLTSFLEWKNGLTEAYCFLLNTYKQV